MNKFIIAFFCICTSYVQAQTYDCAILKKAIAHEVFKEHFSLCRDTTQPLTLIDTNNHFDNTCADLSICNRKLSIDNKWPEGLSLKKNSLKRSRNLLVLFNASVSNSIYRLEFWQPYSNQVAYFRSKKSAEEI